MTEKEEPSGINTGGGAYFAGDVKAGRDIVGRDQTIYAQQGVTIEGFRALLSDMRAMLAEGDLDPETAEIVDGDVRVVEEQAAKPQPKGAIIVAKLEGITKLLAAAAGAAVAAEKLLPYAQKAVEMAGQLFR